MFYNLWICFVACPFKTGYNNITYKKFEDNAKQISGDFPRMNEEDASDLGVRKKRKKT